MANIMTFPDSVNVRLGGSELITSPYTLTKNATFKLQDETHASFASYKINGVKYSSGTVTITDEDITIEGGAPIKVGYEAPIVIIRYQTNGGGR